MRYSIQPSQQDLRSVEPIIETTLETCKSFLVKEDNLRIYLSWNDDFSPETLDSEKLILHLNTSDKNWEEALSSCVAQGYAQSWFLEYKDISFHWENILQLGHSLVFAEQVAGTQFQLDNIEIIEEEWPLIREQLGENTSQNSEELNRLGFSLSYYIAKELSENHELEDFTELKLPSILEVGDMIFT